MNRRRRLLIALGAASVAPQVVSAQAKRDTVVVGWIHPGSRKVDGHFVSAFKEGMNALGWKDGVTFVVEERWLDSKVERTQPLAEELVAKKPAVVIAFGSGASRAVNKVSAATPIVQVAGYPVEFGLAKSLARPGGMVTGLMNIAYELAEKRLELLLDAAPGLKRIGFLIDASSAYVQERALSAARNSIARYPVEARFGEAVRPEEIEPALARLAKDGIQALIVMPGNFVPSERNRVMPVALTQRWPVVTGHPEWTEAGALLSYGADLVALYRRAAYFVDRILKGTKPGDLPIEQPTTFELIINARTARALGLALPRELLVRADRIIK
jgi:putative ABC transport system substrate-binding protein